MHRSEYTANVALTTRATPSSWARPAPRAARVVACDRFLCTLLGVSALSIVACAMLILGA